MEDKKKVGRPAGSVSGSIVDRMPGNIQEQVEYFTKLSERVSTWLSKEENKDTKSTLEDLVTDLNSITNDLSNNILPGFQSLADSNWLPTKTVSSGSINYIAGRQVWLKDDVKADYILMGYTTAELSQLFVINTVKGKVMVSAGKNGKTRIPVAKLHLTVTDPAEVTAE